jgi:sorbitol-specific phosphotransferase system component IIA
VLYRNCVLQGILFYRMVAYSKLCSAGNVVLQEAVFYRIFSVGNRVLQKLCSAGNIVLQKDGLQETVFYRKFNAVETTSILRSWA